MYALHEHGESHDENSETDSKHRLDNVATPEDMGTEEENNHDITGEDKLVNPGLNFNMDGRADLKNSKLSRDAIEIVTWIFKEMLWDAILQELKIGMHWDAFRDA